VLEFLHTYKIEEVAVKDFSASTGQNDFIFGIELKHELYHVSPFRSVKRLLPVCQSLEYKQGMGSRVLFGHLLYYFFLIADYHDLLHSIFTAKVQRLPAPGASRSPTFACS
jgi:hypothetical protein